MVSVDGRELAVPDPALEAEIRRRLEDVEAFLAASVQAETALMSRASGYLLSAGGKRFRPLLLLLSGYFGEDPSDPRLLRAAVATELVHLASLYHDDVMDEADSRRGIPSVNARWDNTVAILTGDFLFARASETAAELGTEVAKLLAVTIGRVCEGQIREFETTGHAEIEEAGYMEVIERKTASLIATACRLGGMLSGADSRVVGQLERFGHALGIAFQLSDDIMDVVSDAETLGKEPGVDLREGVYTLPVIVALRDSEHRDELRRLLEAGPPGEEAWGRVLQIVRSDGALRSAREAVSREVSRALRAAQGLPGGVAREALEHFARFLAERCGAAL